MYTNLNNKNRPEQVSIIQESEVYQKIKNDLEIQQQVTSIRIVTDQFKKTNDLKYRQEKERLKTKLPAFIPSGEFSYRNNESLTQYWGRIVLDIDNHSNPEKLRATIKSNKEPSVIMAFISPSGTGVKIIHKLKIPELNSVEDHIDFHKQAFISLVGYYKKKYKVNEIDSSGSDLCRLCYYSHDDQAYYNPNAAEWEFTYHSASNHSSPLINTQIYGYYTRFENDHERINIQILQRIHDWCLKANIVLLENYHDWIKAMFALKNSISDPKMGLDLFLRLSSTSSKFDQNECINKWNDNNANNIRNKATIGSIVFMAKKVGWLPTRKDYIGSRNILNTNITSIEETDIRLKYNELTHQLLYAETPNSENWSLGNDFIDSKLRLGSLEFSLKREDFDSLMKYTPPRYNPVKDFLHGLPKWDNKDRLKELTETLSLKNSAHKQMAEKLIKRWLIGVVNGLHNNPENSSKPTISPNENLLIIIGDQGIGKTRWMRKLFPEDWNSLFAEKLNFNFDNKDDQLLSCEKAIISMDELSPILNNKATNEQLKGFLSQKTFNIRVAYGRYNSVFYKIASFIGTSNHSEIITDPTGSRRFWPIEIVNANYNHRVDMTQLWAQVYYMWKNGEMHWLTTEEQKELTEYNNPFVKVHPYEEYINRFITTGNDQYTATQMTEFINKHLENKNAINPRQIGQYLKAAGYVSKSVFKNGKTQRLYSVKLIEENLMEDFEKMESKDRKKIKNFKAKENVTAEDYVPQASDLFEDED